MSRLKKNEENFPFLSYIYVSCGEQNHKIPINRLHAKVVFVTNEFGECPMYCIGFAFGGTKDSSIFPYKQ